MKAVDNLQTLQRGLRALALLNRAGPTTVTELARHLDVSRPTAYRLLETLAGEGYCGRSPGGRKYRVTAAVRRLSQAINDDDVLTAVALDPIYRLAAEIKWPLTLATPSATSMLMRITTEHEGPFGLARIPPGALAPMQDTTTGLLYLSLVDSRTRARILSALRAVEPEAARRQDQPGVDSLLRFAVRHRYLIIERPWLREGNLGVAILDGVHPIGGLAMRYIKSALMHDELIDRFLPRLHQLSAEITARYQHYKSSASLDFDRAPVECAAL